jgi:hypothetical protein
MKIKPIIENIHRISTTSGTDFYTLSTVFPELLNEVQNSTNNAEVFNKIKRELSTVVSQQDVLLNLSTDFLNSFKEKNTALFQGFADRLNLLQNMSDIILKIKDESMEMEIISLNAMIVSIKSGKEGQAFSYITSNLKRLSLQLIAQSDALIKNEKKVQEDINQLKSVIDNSENLKYQNKQKKNESSSKLLTAVNLVTNKVNAMLDLAVTVKNPLLGAMECIQMQDIIRQSIDDVEMVLSKVIISTEGNSPEETLDNLNINLQLCDIAIRCLNNIKDKLNFSINKFSEKKESINSILTQVEKLRKDLLIENDTHISAIQKLQNTVNDTLNEFNDTMNTIYEYQESQKTVLTESRNIQDQVHKMQSFFDNISPLINNLEYVAIAQRIEVARNKAISSIQSTVEYMSELIKKTNSNVHKAQEQLQIFIDSSMTQIKRFTKESKKDSDNFSRIFAEKNTFTHNIKELENELINALKGFTVYSDNFFSKYKEIGDTIDNINILAENINKIQEDITEVYSENNLEKQKLLREYNLEDIPVHNEAITDFLRHFTITDDKKEASNVAGFTIDDGVPSGEITFF